MIDVVLGLLIAAYCGYVIYREFRTARAGGCTGCAGGCGGSAGCTGGCASCSGCGAGGNSPGTRKSSSVQVRTKTKGNR